MLPEQELVEALARIDELEALVQSFDAVDKARQAENAKLEAKVARVGAINEKVNIKFNSRGRELEKLREAAQAVVDDIGSMEYANKSIKALAALLEDKEVVYPDEIPVDRAGRPMFNRYGDKLDVEDRE